MLSRAGQEKTKIFFVFTCLSLLEKQSEAHYLREHRGELIQELATTIVQKVSNIIVQNLEIYNCETKGF